MAENTHETKIVINGDASGATGALKGLQNLIKTGIVGSLNLVRSAISRVMSALGLIGLAMQGVTAIIEGYKKLTEWMNRAAKEAAQMRLASIFNDAAAAMDRIISRQAIYNKLLKEELADLSRRKELQDIAKSGKEQREDEKREIARAKEIAGAQDEDEERAIRQRWAVEDETRARGKRYRQLKANVAEEDEKSAIYGSKADAADENVKKADAAIAKLRENFIRMNQEQLKEAQEQIAALQKKREASAAEAEQYRKDEDQANKRAALYRQQIEDVRKGGGVAQAKNDAENAKAARNKAEKEKAKAQNLEDKQLDRKREEELARLDPTSPTYERDKKELERAYEIKAAEAKVGRATNDEDRQAAEEELNAVRIRQGRERGEERAAQIEAYASQMASVGESSRPKDRLTAMGLGSGAVVDRTAQQQAADVKTLVQLLKEQVNLTREKNQANVAVYAP